MWLINLLCVDDVYAGHESDTTDDGFDGTH